MAGQINLEPLDPVDVEQTQFGPDAKRWLTNIVDIINANFVTLSNALASLFATGLSTVGGSGASYTVAVVGLTTSGYVTASLVSSTNDVTIAGIVANSGSFTITFSADPGAGAIIAYQAFASTPN